MLRILIVDDDKDMAATVQERLEEHFDDDCQCQYELSFEVAVGKIRSLHPDVVVLDIWDGEPQESTTLGMEVLDQIWDQLFCPVVIHSALPPPDIREHPFIHPIAKDDQADSVQEVLHAIVDMQPHIKALKKGEESIRNAFAAAMKTVAPYAFQQFPDDASTRTDIIARAGRRRVAALMDEPLLPDTALAPWEQYLCPPVTDDLLLGDILRVADGTPEDPNGFRLVLTPSCDLAQSGGQTPKVDKVLVAKCCSLEEGLKKAGLAWNTDSDKLKSHPLFSQGNYQSVLSLPHLEGQIPPMAANFHTLELIPMACVSQYCRVASLDSPFREAVAWAYLQNTGRPGLPKRDFSQWLPDIRAACSEASS